jgi:hypothetical protein
MATNGEFCSKQLVIPAAITNCSPVVAGAIGGEKADLKEGGVIVRTDESAWTGCITPSVAGMNDDNRNATHTATSF